ncbi:MAG: serine/threonine protein kinase [Pseudobdellovibrionaceae bacterium]
MPMSNGFYQLNPDQVLASVENAGFQTTGVFWQLNSYENRVFDIELEAGEGDLLPQRVIAKFYRPGRWSQAAILEEHQFLQELAEEDVSAVAPLLQKNQKTLSLQDNIFLALFPKFKGRMPQELSLSEMTQVGSLLARLHNLGAGQRSQHRPILNTEYYGGWNTLDYLQPLVAPEVRDRYLQAATHILNVMDDTFDVRKFIRIHGDCHRGNLLKTENRFAIIDFDDFCMGPEVQDFWMLLSGDQDQLEAEKEALLEGYSSFREFPEEQWEWIPLLRGLRLISYSGWIAHRWDDPSFPKLFPEFNTYKYWAEETEALEKIAWLLHF